MGTFEQYEELANLCIAVHESAHAVVAWKCDMEVEKLKLEYGFFSGQVTRGWVRTIGDEEVTTGVGAVFAAGAMAQEKWLLEQGVLPAHAAYMSDYSGESDARVLRDLVREFKLSEAACRSLADRLIDEHWEQILRVGALLEARGQLAGKKAK